MPRKTVNSKTTTAGTTSSPSEETLAAFAATLPNNGAAFSGLPKSRISTGHHLAPSHSQTGWISGGTVVGDSLTNGVGSSGAGRRSVSDRWSASSAGSVGSVGSSVGGTGLRLPTPVKKVGGGGGRNRYNIAGSRLTDWVASIFCVPCVQIQERSEMAEWEIMAKINRQSALMMVNSRRDLKLKGKVDGCDDIVEGGGEEKFLISDVAEGKGSIGCCTRFIEDERTLTRSEVDADVTRAGCENDSVHTEEVGLSDTLTSAKESTSDQFVSDDDDSEDYEDDDDVIDEVEDADATKVARVGRRDSIEMLSRDQFPPLRKHPRVESLRARWA
ncbi:hypothetical protein HDU76_014112 [Blyttiomyces sp. JEL0837]|nr:hypothetical protein HDU76_014112 [Blyttiomyces sp. JEL0837]